MHGGVCNMSLGVIGRQCVGGHVLDPTSPLPLVGTLMSFGIDLVSGVEGTSRNCKRTKRMRERGEGGGGRG